MTVVKPLAFVAMALAVVAQAASAGAIGGDGVRRPSGLGEGGDAGVQGTVVSGLFASLANTPVGSASSPSPSVPVSVGDATDATGKWAVVDNAATVAAAGGGSAPTGTGFAPAAPASAPSRPTYDAFINLGNGPYANAGLLTTGNGQPWYDSRPVAALFGGQPSPQQQAAFTQAVVQRVQQTFQLSGVPVALTADPSATAAHTLSVVSNTTSAWGPVLGLTNVGSSGFSFIDQAAKSSRSVDQLEWIVAHNVSHELMLAFGVGENYDHTGKYIDAPVANWSMMTDPNATFSRSAAQALLAANFQEGANPWGAGAQQIGPQAVPEPTTIALWTALAGGLGVAHSRRRKAAGRTSAGGGPTA